MGASQASRGGSTRGMGKGKATKKGAEGPKKSVAGGYGSITRPTPGGGRKALGPNKAKAAGIALHNEGRKPAKKKK